jgi:hypothetical protein
MPIIDMIALASERRSNRALAETDTVGDASDVTPENAGTNHANMARG